MSAYESEGSLTKTFVVRNLTPSIGYLGSYTRELAKKGFISLLFSNTNGSVLIDPRSKSTLGTTPISIGLPTSTNNPVVLDMASSKMSWSEIDRQNMISSNSQAKEDIGYSKEFIPTKKFSEILDGGYLMNFGETKGLALNLVLELLIGATTSTLISRESFIWGAILIVIKPESFDTESISRFVISHLKGLEQTLRLPGPGYKSSLKKTDIEASIYQLQDKYNFKFYSIHNVN